MAELATKSDPLSPQKEGTRIANVNKQGSIQRYNGKIIPDDKGIAITNDKWGDRSMGNGGAPL